jgi:hypothetical protein
MGEGWTENRRVIDKIRPQSLKKMNNQYFVLHGIHKVHIFAAIWKKVFSGSKQNNKQ